MPDVDVVIIGAGAAGLAAARIVSDRGLSLAILEARSRIGGRIHTVRPAGDSLPLELGAEFVHGRQPVTFALAQEAGLTLYESTGRTWLAGQGRLVATAGFGDDDVDEEDGAENDDDDASVAEEIDPENGFATILTALAKESGPDRTFQAFLDERFPGPRWDGARRSARGFVEGYDAADPVKVSAQWLAYSEAADDPVDGDRQYRVLAGYDRLLEALRGRLDPARATLHLNSEVTQITWSPGQVTVTTRAPSGSPYTSPESFTARAVIITLPLGVLAAPDGAPGAVRFVPALPEKTSAIAQLAMGHTVKVVLRFREIFWDMRAPTLPQLPRLGFLFAGDATFPTWWSSYPVLHPTLAAWLGGPRAAQLAGLPSDEVAGRAVATLAHVLGISRQALESELTGWDTHSWSDDPYARGAYTYVLAGGMDAPRKLGAPVADTLFFAGEATDAADTGTVHAALKSGQRAASEVLARLTPRGG